jgi:hypothetical protein
LLPLNTYRLAAKYMALELVVQQVGSVLTTNSHDLS